MFLCVRHTRVLLFVCIFSFSLWDWKGNITVKDKTDCDIPSDIYLFSIFGFCWLAFPNRFVSSSFQCYTLKWFCGTSVAAGRSDILMWKVSEWKGGKSVKKPRWLDAAAGSKTGNQKIWETCVCLFHKALISCFISSSTCGRLPAGLVVLVFSFDRTPLQSHTYTAHIHTQNG